MSTNPSAAPLSAPPSAPLSAPLSATLLPGVPLVESPLFAQSIEAMGLTDEERRIAVDLHEKGFAVLDFPDAEIDARIDRIKANLSPRYGAGLTQPAEAGMRGNLRIQDAWRFDDDVRAIAANAAILDLLGKLYGRRAFPFQTLNFPIGTEQHAHTDSAHFSSLPERFMCGVWLAMEDIEPEAGPLLYYPGSHAWPLLTNAMIGRRGWKSPLHSAQDPFEAVWQAMVDARGVAPESFCPRKGQALIWAANLLHGGSPRTDPRKTRWSQVTHYYFADCIYYTPAFSDEALGLLDLRTITNAATGEIEANRLLGEDVRPAPEAKSTSLGASVGGAMRRWLGGGGGNADDMPADFDADRYLLLNPDVATAGHDPAGHYRAHGRGEGRRYR